MLMDRRPSDGVRRPGATVFVVGLLMIATLLPLALSAVGHAASSLVMACLLLGLVALVRPTGEAALLRWIPGGFGILALVAGVMTLFT